jgi:hypothetical protein
VGWARATAGGGSRGNSSGGEVAVEAAAEEEQVYTCIIRLPELAVVTPPLVVEVKAPPVGRLRALLPVTYSISNYSTLVQDVEYTIQPHETIMYSGSRHANIRILPADIGPGGEVVPTQKDLQYNLFPLRGGFATLPLLSVKSKRTDAEIPVTKGLPRVYIKAVEQGVAAESAA